MEKRYATHPEQAKSFTSEELRSHYLVQDLFVPDEVKLCYTLEDRMITGGILPANGPVRLEGYDEIKADYFMERRELGVFNVGGGGWRVVFIRTEKTVYTSD
ncbi:4-deoxy-L-threo-5-hexosulose-uronate ketol-isomerase [Paenibacillus macquariensis]|uniref:5-dehydro-4-deoxy-D-glucuronate isomerase n=1 Tax=Paenibacillus macquariensis TaxID=948756 RepID=A0ABY1JKT9_9BACL|nr:4-deoxy-L-threo-5-hexosulose-uronate ketol-isomerase [Paenibacillus macquariensis]